VTRVSALPREVEAMIKRMAWTATPRGRYVVKDGQVVPSLPLPEGVTKDPGAELYSPSLCQSAPVPVIGPTRLGEMLMIDIRVATKVEAGTRLHSICEALDSSPGGC
jgi:hypothetical protein